jgi:hypothetical protein
VREGVTTVRGSSEVSWARTVAGTMQPTKHRSTDLAL